MRWEIAALGGVIACDAADNSRKEDEIGTEGKGKLSTETQGGPTSTQLGRVRRKKKRSYGTVVQAVTSRERRRETSFRYPNCKQFARRQLEKEEQKKGRKRKWVEKSESPWIIEASSE